MVAIWFLVIIGIVTVSTCGTYGDTIVETGNYRIVIKPKGDSNLCIKTENSILKLGQCSDGGQIFDKLGFGSRGFQLRIAKKKQSKSGGLCLVTSQDDDGDGESIVTTVCNKSSRKQLWSIRKSNSFVKMINKSTKTCISAEANDGALVLASKCSNSDDQLWTTTSVNVD